MNSFEKTKAVTYVFELEDEKLLRLTYLLQPNSLREKWIEEIKSYRNIKIQISKNTHIYIYKYVDINIDI